MKRLLALAILMLGVLASPATADPIRDQVIASQSQVKAIMDGLAAKDSATDPNYYSNCHWYVGGTDGGPEVKMGHAALAAAVYTYTKDLYYFVRAVNSINCYLTEQGATGGGDVNMGFFGAQLGAARLAFDTTLSATVKAQWDAALKAIVDSWRADGNVPTAVGGYGWFTNGNIEAWETLVTYYAQRFNPTISYLATTHQAQREFMLDPPANAGGGYNAGTNAGLRFLDATKGYLTENGGPGGPIGAGWGYDPYYTMVQDSALAPWAMASNSPVAVSTLNPIFNSGLARTNTTTWVLDATGGTRRSFYTPFVSGGLYELAMNQGRTDLQQYISSNWAEVIEQYGSSTMSPGKSRGFGTVLGTIVHSGQKYNAAHP